MFTGIVEEVGYIKSFEHKSNGAVVAIRCKKVLEDTKLGDSICINGVCTTVVNIGSDYFMADISDETLKVTNFSNLQTNQIVNLERALMLNSRLGGHIVSGHVDCQGKAITIEKQDDFYEITFQIPQNQSKYVVYKGSIAINGISLTVAEVKNDLVKVAVIPHTYNETNLKSLKNNDFVNIETDILGKYVEKMLSANDNTKERISFEFLAENGFV